MALFDDFGATYRGLLDQVDRQAIPQLLEPILRKSSIRNLQGLVDRLEQHGFSDRVLEWASRGTARISSVEIRSALKPGEVSELAETMGLPPESAMSLLADKLPAAIDAATHSGGVVVHGAWKAR